MLYIAVFFFFKQKTAYEMRISDWSSDVCSSDLTPAYLYEAMVGAEEPLYRTGGLELPEIEQPPDLLNQLVRGTGTVGLGMLAPGAALKTATQLVPTARGPNAGLTPNLTATARSEERRAGEESGRKGQSREWQ